MAAGVLASLASGALVSAVPDFGLLEVLLAATLLCQKSLAEHVRTVADGLRYGLQEGRNAVGKIVGRDVRYLDGGGVARAAIESAAENFSDGVVAPAFWFAVLGLPGIVAYKFINTADSMIGYRSDRFREFGWAAAKLDDMVNYVPARLSAALIAIAHGRWSAFRIMRDDAPRHRSPNAGWPEAALASVLGVALSGPRTYGGVAADFPLRQFERPQGDINQGHRPRRPCGVAHMACGLRRTGGGFAHHLVNCPAIRIMSDLRMRNPEIRQYLHVRQVDLSTSILGSALTPAGVEPKINSGTTCVIGGIMKKQLLPQALLQR